MLKVYNSLTRRKNQIIKKGLNFFVCGPTVYDDTHIGHARTYVAYDAFVRFLRFLKFQVFFLMNITDVDDKIINRAKAEHKSSLALARKFERAFLRDLKTIRVVSMNKVARASAFIPEIIAQIKTLIRRGYAYPVADGSVYFRTKKFKAYGQLSRQNINQLKDLEKSELKEDPLDFSLWKGRPDSDQFEPVWPSPWGAGRPGWHIEDTAISEKFFGPQYDIHGGGLDLIFPHHEAEIAQQEAASGQSPLVKIWMHTGLLNIEGQKMSKSLRNFIVVKDFFKQYPARFLRFFILSHHWRSVIDCNARSLKEAWANYFKINEFIAKLQITNYKLQISEGKTRSPKGLVLKQLKAFKQKFILMLEDDFNTAAAVNYLLAFINKNETQIDANLNTNWHELLGTLKEFDSFFVCFFPWQAIPAATKTLMKKRIVLRQNKKFREADAIRAKLQKDYLYLEDTADKTLLINLN